MEDTNLENNTTERNLLDKKISSNFFKILENGRSYMEEASAVFEALSSLKPMLRGYKKEAYDILENYSKIYPDKTISEILEETHNIHGIKSEQYKKNYLDQVKEVLKGVRELAVNEPKVTEDLDIAEPEVLDVIYQETDVKIRNHKIKKIYNRVLNKNKCAFLFHKLMNEIGKLPISKENADTFLDLAYKKNWTDAKIITSMFQSSLSSEECIIPLKENGPNKIGNKIVFCNNCVRNRKEVPYNLFIKLHPEMVENLQKQMNIIANEILAKNLDGNFRFYPLIIAHKFKELSNNMISLDLVTYCQEILKDSNSRILELNAEIERYTNSRNEKFNSIKKYPKLESDFLREINRIEMKLDKTKNQIATEKNLQKHINDYLASTKISNQ